MKYDYHYRLLTIIFSLLSLQLVSFGQRNVEWSLNLGGSLYEVAYDVMEIENGNILVVGSSRSNDHDVSGYIGALDIWLVKLNASGTIVWERNYGGSDSDAAYSLFMTRDSAYIVAGSSQSSDGDIQSENQGDSDVWLFKMDFDGNILWECSFGGSGMDRAFSVQEYENGDLMVFAETESSDGDISNGLGRSDYWVLKLNMQGDLLWEKTYGGSFYDFPEKAIISSNGEYIITGDSSSDDGDVGPNNSQCNYWIVKLDSSGAINSSHLYGGDLCEINPNLKEIQNGKFIVFGSSSSTTGDVSTNNGGLDYWIAMINEDDEIAWEKSYGGSNDEWGRSIIETDRNTFILVGSSESDDQDVSGNHGKSDIWIMEVDSSGNMIWSDHYGGSESEVAWSGTRTSDGGFVVTGNSYSSDSDLFGNYNDSDIFIIKFSQFSSTENQAQNSTLEFYPNPSPGNVTVRTQNGKQIERIDIFDSYGRVAQTLSNPQPQITFDQLPIGIYYFHIHTDDQYYVRKMFKYK